MAREQVEITKPQISFGDFERVDMRVAEVLSAKEAVGARIPSRVFELDLGPLGKRQSVGQYALLAEDYLVGKKVVVCCNLGVRQMGKYVSEVLLMGVPHPDSIEGQHQAFPLMTDLHSTNGDRVF